MDVVSVEINEVGPREGFQFEGIGMPEKISTDDKTRLITALSTTGLRRIEVASFVSPRAVPQMADAEVVLGSLEDVPGVEYTGIFLNERGFRRALEAPHLSVEGRILLTASETFLRRNQNRSHEEDIEAQRELVRAYLDAGLPADTAGLMAAFGCNYEGDIPLARVLECVGQLVGIAADAGVTLRRLYLADTMGWADPVSVQRVVRAVRESWPDLELALHIHDTRGMGMASVYAALEVGVRVFDTSVAGLGGCPFAGVAAGNVPTEDLVFLCQRLGIETGVDLDRLLECAVLAEEIVGHPLPSRMLAVARSGGRP
jgi:hydroxymethylglutaryl-CoA lyase